MNKRGFLATLAAMCVAPFAAKAATKQLTERQEWINGEFREVFVGRLGGPFIPFRISEEKGNPEHILSDFAKEDRATISGWIFWEGEGRKHTTAVGHRDNGDVWVYTVTGMRRP